MGVLHPCQPAFSDAHTAVAPHQLLVLEAKICSFEMRWGVQPWMDCGLETREPVFPRPPHMEMRIESALTAICHQNLHLRHRQVLNVLILGASVLNIGFASKPNRLVLVLKDAGSL